MVKDEPSGNDFGHKESRQGDFTTGTYYVVLPDGRKQIVEYEADANGYRPKISYEEGYPVYNGNGNGAQGRGGYNYNAQDNGYAGAQNGGGYSSGPSNGYSGAQNNGYSSSQNGYSGSQNGGYQY